MSANINESVLKRQFDALIEQEEQEEVNMTTQSCQKN